MKRMDFGPWIIEVDVAQTKKFYTDYHVITDDCDCLYCENYIFSCDQFSPKLNDFFNLLGIDPRKAGEISEFGKQPDGTHLYISFYHIVGRIIAGLGSEDNKELAYNIDGFGIDFSEELDLVQEAFPAPTIQVNIEMHLPWLVGEE